MIRPAKPEDKAAAARLILAAIDDIAYKLTGATTEPDVIRGLEEWFCQSGNRISHEHTLVKEMDGRVVGLVIYYHGKTQSEIDKPIVEWLRKTYNDPGISLDQEADDDEWYIDTVSVLPSYQGRGYGTDLIRAVENYVEQHGAKNVKVALNVAQSNEKARRLYTKLGYVKDKEIQINHHPYDHMVLI